MPINMNTTTLEEGPVEIDELIVEVQRTSALMNLVPVRPITHKGATLPIVPSTTVRIVGEGELKPVTDKPITSLVAKGYTFATLVPLTKQLLADKPALMAAIAAQGASDIKAKFDAQGTGETEEGKISSFGDLSEVKVSVDGSTLAGFFEAKARVSASKSRVTGLLVSNMWLARQQGATYESGARKFNITVNEDGFTGMFEGIPFAAYESDETIAYMGDFKGKAIVGSAYGIDFEINEKGMLGEGANAINLFDRNMVSARVEAELAFNYVPEAFVKLTLPALDAE